MDHMPKVREFISTNKAESFDYSTYSGFIMDPHVNSSLNNVEVQKSFEFRNYLQF